MKPFLILFTYLFVGISGASAQITTPIIKANFGVDADMRSNFFNGFVQSGNDDWFMYPGSIGTGQFIIDTTGAAGLMAQYAANPNSRKLPFYRNMRFTPYRVVNNRLLVDAYYVRDYHGDDSTIFASGSNKNGMSPADWSCPVSQSVPDKNEILDIMLHVRRAGPNTTDSMWMMGAISIENTTGSRYFDFELYQTDIYYNRTTRQFYNYGPHAGHTRWQFDAAGNMTAPGDIIFTAEYSSSSLTKVEARIWIDRADLLITPAGFNFTGEFDGAGSGSQYGYAGIRPKAVGNFYTGLQSVANTWAGPFGVVLGDNNLYSTYEARQYMEFSVNMSKLGLDQAQIFGGDDCQMPFRRVFVKTRASTSFTAELKDFVAPFDFFMAPKAEIETMAPIICDTGSVSTIYVANPISTSVYQWSTTNGNIISSTTGPSIDVNRPGVYIVKQYLQSGCSVYAEDTITIGAFPTCELLANNKILLQGEKLSQGVSLTLKLAENQQVKYFTIERSSDGIHYEAIHRQDTRPVSGISSYVYTDRFQQLTDVYYRVRLYQVNNKEAFSNTLHYNFSNASTTPLITPNPVQELMHLQVQSLIKQKATVMIYDQMNRLVDKITLSLDKGKNIFTLDCLANERPGIYQAIIHMDGKVYTQRLLRMQ